MKKKSGDPRKRAALKAIETDRRENAIYKRVDNAAKAKDFALADFILWRNGKRLTLSEHNTARSVLMTLEFNAPRKLTARQLIERLKKEDIERAGVDENLIVEVVNFWDSREA